MGVTRGDVRRYIWEHAMYRIYLEQIIALASFARYGFGGMVTTYHILCDIFRSEPKGRGSRSLFGRFTTCGLMDGYEYESKSKVDLRDLLVVIHLNMTTITAKATMTFTTSPISFKVVWVYSEDDVEVGLLPG